MVRAFAFIALPLALTGCSLITVESTSGTKEMPVELRSSTDDYRPPVGVADLPTTRPGVISRVSSAPGDAVTKVYEALTVNSFKEAAHNLRNEDADIRRVALTRVAGRSYGAGLPYTDVYRTTAQVDPDGLVRATAIRSLNRVRDTQSGPVFVAALADGHPQVRLEACKALANLPTPEAEGPLRTIAQANDQPLDVRIAALDALRHYRSLETQRVFVGQLNSSNFALAWESRRSLFLQTNADYRYDEAAWLNYLTTK